MKHRESSRGSQRGGKSIYSRSDSIAHKVVTKHKETIDEDIEMKMIKME